MAEPMTEEERAALEASVRRSECNCGQVVRTEDYRAGINATRVAECPMHAALRHDPKLLPRLVAYRRYAGRLWFEEMRDVPLREGDG